MENLDGGGWGWGKTGRRARTLRGAHSPAPPPCFPELCAEQPGVSRVEPKRADFRQRGPPARGCCSPGGWAFHTPGPILNADGIFQGEGRSLRSLPSRLGAGPLCPR